MTDRPILFSTPMVLALLAGRKTQTRRVIADGATGEAPAKPPRFAVGDRLWVREAWRTGLAYEDLSPSEMGGDEQVLFEADGLRERWTKRSSEPGRLRPAMFMPRWASRLTLIVTDVRMQRLQRISETDARAEGIVPLPSGRYFCGYDEDGEITARSPVTAYGWLWDSLNAARGYSWESNPFVVAVGFDVRHGNIDQAGG